MKNMTKAIITCKSGRKYEVDNFRNIDQHKNDLFVEFRAKDCNELFDIVETVLYLAKNSIESIDLVETGDSYIEDGVKR